VNLTIAFQCFRRASAPAAATLDDRGPRQLGVEGEHLDDGRQADPHSLQPGPLGVAARDHRVEHSFDEKVIGGEEALVLVLEMLVEGRAGDVCLRDHVGDEVALYPLRPTTRTIASRIN
jgi:hypothetical protein